MTKVGTLRTRMSSKGQIVIPRELRERRGWSEGTEMLLEETTRGVLLLRPEPERTLELSDLVGCAGYSGRRHSLAEMAQGIVSEARRRGGR
jgi:AbrB family looped-hinge helix DNA binding protein